MKVLFVTGDLRDGDFLEHEIKKVPSDIQIEISPDVRDAASRLDPSSANYDVVLIESVASNGECQALLNHIRQQNLLLPVVVIIGPNEDDPPVKLLAGGADDYIVKRPNYVSRIPALLQQALERYRGRAQRRARTIRVLYAGDMENARRHLGSVPFVELEVAVVNADGSIHRPTGAHPASLSCDLVVLEDQALGVHVLKVLKDVTSRWPDYPVVVLLAPGQEELAIQALRLGAADCIIKSGDYYGRFLMALDGLISRRDLVREKMALRSSEERLRMVIEFVPTCVTLLALDGTFLAMNWAGLSLVGAKHVDDIVGKNLFALAGPAQEGQLRSFVTRICSGERDSIRIKWEGLDGLARELELRAVPLRRDQNGTTAALTVMQDVSNISQGGELKELQERCDRLSQALKAAETVGLEVADQRRVAEAAIATAEVKLAEAVARHEGERARWESASKEFEQQLRSAEERSATLEEALLAAKSRYADLTESHQAEMSQLESRMLEVRQKAQAIREEKNTLEEILHELQGKHEEFVGALRAEKTQAEAAREELAQRLAGLEGERGIASDELTGAKARIAELESLLDSERTQWQRARLELEECRTNAEAQAAFVNNLLGAAEERYAALRENFNAESSSWEAARQEFDRQKVELLGERNALDAEKEAVEQRLSEALAAAEKERSRIEAERQDLERLRQSAEEQKQLAEERAGSLEQDLRMAEAKLAETAATIQAGRDAWETARLELEQRISDALAQVGTLEEAVRAAEKGQSEQSESHRAAEARWEQERVELEGRLRSAQGEREVLREVSRTVQLQLDQVAASFDTERSHWLTARQQLESRCQGLEEMESSRSQALRAAETRLAESAAQSQGERDAWDAARQDLDQRLHAAEAHHQGLQEALRTEQARRCELENAERAARNELERVRAELQDLARAGEEQRASLEASLAAAESWAAELSERIETERARWDALRQELEQQCRGMEREKAGLEETLGSSRALCEELAAQLQEEKGRLQPKLIEIEEKYRRAEDSRAALAEELQAARTECEGLSEQLRLRSEEYQEIVSALDVQKGEVERLRQLQRETVTRHQELIKKWSSDFEQALTSTVAHCQQEEEERMQKIAAQQRAERESLEGQLARACAESQRLAEEAESVKRSLEAELDAMSSRHHRIVEGGLVSYALTTPEGRLLGCNDALARVLGYESAGNTLKAVPDLLKPVVDENGGPGGRLRESGAMVDVRCRTRRADGHPVVLQGYASPLAGKKGEPPRLEWFFSDITERHVLEGELRRGRRMEAVGRLASEVAPALNDLLTSVESLCSRLTGTEAGRVAGRELADRVTKDAGRARRLAHQLWMFSQKQDRKPEVLDLNSLLRDQESILRRLTGEDIDLRLSLDPEPQRVSLVRQELEQVLSTLVVIARDALPAGGTVTLETGRTQVEEADQRRDEGVLPGTYVQLAVSALGCGARTASSTSTLEDVIRRNAGFSRIATGQESETMIQVFLPHYPGEPPPA